MPMNHVSLLAGLLMGLSVAVPIGPMGLLCIQRTLTSGMRAGVSTGLGAATGNILVAGLIIFGLDRLAPLLANGSRVLSFAGGIYLLWSAARTALRRPSLRGPSLRGPSLRGPSLRSSVPDIQPQTMTISPLAAYGSAVAFNVTNPMSAMLIIALMTPFVALSSPSPAQAIQLLVGMFAAITCWWICLSGGITLLRSRLSPAMLLLVNQVAAAVLTVYGALALARSAGL